ncbi:MAG: hypothetical protein N2035_02155 [Chthoniobacterales bacterium]|nr:hypothetical protein [Chthoniobacterales bacterium]
MKNETTDDDVNEIAKFLLGSDNYEIYPLHSGGNNSIFIAKREKIKIVIKKYFRDLRDKRDRYDTEKKFYLLELENTPKSLFWNDQKKIAAFEYIEGNIPNEVTSDDIQNIVKWICYIQKKRDSFVAKEISLASDACLSIRDHIFSLKRRIDKLLNGNLKHKGFMDFFQNELYPKAQKIINFVEKSFSSKLDYKIVENYQILSPSDFGYHNILKGKDNKLWFFDFEYSGWDDPAKLICDFFCQPQVSVPLGFSENFINALVEFTGDKEIANRFEILYPLHQVKWACILLNEFSHSGAARRKFAKKIINLDNQLTKAKKLLCQIKTF